MNTVYFDEHVQGVSHEAKGMPCQDFSGACEVSGARGMGFAIVVADGHGDPTCRRSDRGSRMAVEVTLDRLSEVAERYLNADDDTWRTMRESWLQGAGAVTADEERPEDSNADAADASRDIRATLTQGIVDGWRAAIVDDYESDPLPELAQAMAESDVEWRNKAMRRLYGTTLVAGLMLPDLCLLLQQGDGCATVIFGDGQAPLARGDVIPEDELCVGNVTTSISDADAADRMRVVAIDGQAHCVAALFVGTDGVDKSLPSGGDSDLFAGIALDVLGRVDGDGWDALTFDGDLEGMMGRLSGAGSGDDVSIASVMDVDLVREVAGQLAKEREAFDLRMTIEHDRARLGSMSRKYEYYLTLEPTDELAARERDAYLEEYRRLEQRIRSLERDLGAYDVDLGKTNEGTSRVDSPDLEGNTFESSSSPSTAESMTFAAGEEESDTADRFDRTSGHAGTPRVEEASPAFSPTMRMPSTHDEVPQPRQIVAPRNTPARTIVIALIVVLLIAAIGIGTYLVTAGIVGGNQQDSAASVSEENEVVDDEEALRPEDAFPDHAVPTSDIKETRQETSQVESESLDESSDDDELPTNEEVQSVLNDTMEQLELGDYLESVAQRAPEAVGKFENACKTCIELSSAYVAHPDDGGVAQVWASISCLDLGDAVQEAQAYSTTVEEYFDYLIYQYINNEYYIADHETEEKMLISLEQDSDGTWKVSEDSLRQLATDIEHSLCLDAVSEAANELPSYEDSGNEILAH